MREKLYLLSCFGFQTLGFKYGSFTHRFQTPLVFFTGLQNYIRFCSKAISVLWFNCNERLRRSYGVSEVVKGAGWKQMKVGWRTVLRFGRLCVGDISGRSGQNGLCFEPGQHGSTSVDAHTFQCFGFFGSHKEGMALKGIGTLESMGDKVMSDNVFQLWFLTIRVSTDVVHRLVVGKAVSDASPPDKVYIAGDALRGNVQKSLKVWISDRDKIVFGPFVIFLDLWCAGFSIETTHIPLDWIQFPRDFASSWFCRFQPYLNSINLAEVQELGPTMVLSFSTILWVITFTWFWPLLFIEIVEETVGISIDPKGEHGISAAGSCYHETIIADDPSQDHPQGR
ncbi:hypothetical protein V6N12_046203 [Hibiscus sabdariffa]|uniref:Uncharacterized protein n=1 Tax=Hibiscus sabdariffa TaxID=183260 RepID=A0ABR2ANY0_9ROSI